MVFQACFAMEIPFYLVLCCFLFCSCVCLFSPLKFLTSCLQTPFPKGFCLENLRVRTLAPGLGKLGCFGVCFY